MNPTEGPTKLRGMRQNHHLPLSFAVGACLALAALLSCAKGEVAAPQGEGPWGSRAALTDEATLGAPEGHPTHAMPVPPEALLGAAPRLGEDQDPCEVAEPEPLPPPGSPGSREFWSRWLAPLPPVTLWNPPGPKRVGLQAGHWRDYELPQELSRARGGGTSGGGRAEWEVNLDLAQRVAALLEAQGVTVDLLPATVPPRYQAHAFLAIHADGDRTGTLRGFKVTRPGFSSIPEADDALVEALNREYAPATGLRREDTQISRRMRFYYAFNSRRYCHAVAPGVPAAIIETGFLTNPLDRQVLLEAPDRAAEGIARGILAFLGLPEPEGEG